MMNDSYLPGTLMVAYALRQQAVTADLVCMVTSEISEFAREALNIVYDKVIEVDSITPIWGARCLRVTYWTGIFLKLSSPK